MGTNGLWNWLITYEVYFIIRLDIYSHYLLRICSSYIFLPRIRLLPTLIAFRKLVLPQQEV